MKEQRYILDFAITQQFEGEKEIIPSLNGKFVKNKESFFNVSLSANKLYENDWEFNYLIPDHLDDYKEVKFICDFHSWIGRKPHFFYGIPISKRMKKAIEGFNLYPNQFYNAKVLFKEQYLEYYVWQFFLNGFDKFVDFNNSTFCEWKRGNKLGSEIIKVKNYEDLMDIEDEKDWRNWGFERAVMNSEFRDNDCFSLPYPYGMLISERLKNALEAAKPALTGFEITPFPVEFEYL